MKGARATAWIPSRRAAAAIPSELIRKLTGDASGVLVTVHLSRPEHSPRSASANYPAERKKKGVSRGDRNFRRFPRN